MIALYIPGGLLILLFLIAMLSVTAELSFSEAGLTWNIKLGGVLFLPRKEKKRPAGSDEPSKPKPPIKNLESLKRFSELHLHLLRLFFKRVKIDRLRIRFLSAFDDPYDTAMAYSYAGIAMETITGIADGRIRELDLHTDLDFNSDAPRLDFYIHISGRLITFLRLIRLLQTGRAKIYEELSAKEKKHVESTDR